jgi:diguanylate cyclase (GGDEF)-like protein
MLKRVSSQGERSASVGSWFSVSPAGREMIRITAIISLIWITLVRSGLANQAFSWAGENPDSLANVIIPAIVLSAVGIASTTTIRYWRLRQESRERDVLDVEAQRLAYQDPLTGLDNRTALNERLDALEASASDQQLALIIVDLDRFKSVNDVHGHLAGDRLLRLAAERMLEVCASGQTIFRLGGDEFAVLVPIQEAADKEPKLIASRIVERMLEPFDDSGLVHHIGASAGIATYPFDAIDGDALIRAADVALYRAKNFGRGQFRSFEQAMDDQIRQRARLESELRLAVELGEFIPYYQPLVDLKTGATIGFELLARWQRPDGVSVGPDQFVPIAEECGLIGELLLGLLEHACIDARQWDPTLTIAVNISPVQLKDPMLSQKILGRLARHGFPAQRISIEITENAIIADEGNARRTIESLKNQGMKIGLDDFGTGYSSLHHLRILPFDKIKIDKSFVMNIDEDPEALKIVKAIIGLANSLDLPVVAEGIESVSIADTLRQLGCAQGQGYLFGRPLPAVDVSRNLLEPPIAQWPAALPGKREAA